MLNLTKALGAKNDSYSDIMDLINFEIKLAQVRGSRIFHHLH